MSTEQFVDPLENLINKHKSVESPVEETVENSTDDSTSTKSLPLTDPYGYDSDDINYGDDDLEEEIKREEIAAEEEKQRIREANMPKEKETTTMPPHVYDMKYHEEAIGFQADKVAIVTTMVNKVIAKHHITSGSIPEYTPEQGNLRMKVMGELIDLYHKDGEVITPEFEALILNNWVDDNGTTASDIIKNRTTEDVPDKNPTDVVEEKPETPTININVEKGTPVTINVDESIVAETATTNEVNIYVKEVSEEELLKTTIIENSQQEGIINIYDSGINDVPITLPLSGYRCVMRPINWFDFIKLTAPTSQNSSDNELKKWSVIYEHMKNISIGDFENFDDFLKKTKYQDKELLMWAILVATADEEETLSLKCANPKCRREMKIKYFPREIIHLDEEKIPKHYTETHKASIGEEAINVFNKVNGSRTRYLLPNTKIIVEINEPSAYEFITQKLPLVQKLYERYRPGQDMSKFDPNDPEMMEFDYLSANILFISAMTIVRDGKEYRYTNWEDIERIITKSLDADDSGILLKIIEKARTNVSPVSFYISNISCPSCHHSEDKIAINDIGNTLLFQVSRRLASTTISLIEMD